MKRFQCAAAALTFLTPLTHAQETPPPPATEESAAGAEAGKPETAEASLDPEQEALLKKINAFNYQTGTVKTRNGRATFTLPEGYRFLDARDGKVLIEDIWGNPPGSGSDIEGVVLPRGQEVADPQSWAVVVQFEDDGYVSDGDADEIDYDDLLQTLKKAAPKPAKNERPPATGK